MTDAAVAHVLRESWFWAGIFRDHATFIHDNLVPGQERLIRWAAELRHDLAALTDEAETLGRQAGLVTPLHHDVGALAQYQGHELGHHARAGHRLRHRLLELLSPLRELKQELLQRKLDCQVRLNLPPSFLQHMINEAVEATRMLSPAHDTAPPPLELLHQHLLWLKDAAGHAGYLQSGADAPERALRDQSHAFMLAFEGLYLKADELHTMLRVAPRLVGALRKLNVDALGQMAAFHDFLAELREHLEGCEVMGILMPLIADHMLREELYYTEKVAAVR